MTFLLPSSSLLIPDLEYKESYLVGVFRNLLSLVGTRLVKNRVRRRKRSLGSLMLKNRIRVRRRAFLAGDCWVTKEFQRDLMG